MHVKSGVLCLDLEVSGLFPFVSDQLYDMLNLMMSEKLSNRLLKEENCIYSLN